MWINLSRYYAYFWMTWENLFWIFPTFSGITLCWLRQFEWDVRKQEGFTHISSASSGESSRMTGSWSDFSSPLLSRIFQSLSVSTWHLSPTEEWAFFKWQLASKRKNHKLPQSGITQYRFDFILMAQQVIRPTQSWVVDIEAILCSEEAYLYRDRNNCLSLLYILQGLEQCCHLVTGTYLLDGWMNITFITAYSLRIYFGTEMVLSLLLLLLLFVLSLPFLFVFSFFFFFYHRLSIIMIEHLRIHCGKCCQISFFWNILAFK